MLEGCIHFARAVFFVDRAFLFSVFFGAGSLCGFGGILTKRSMMRRVSSIS